MNLMRRAAYVVHEASHHAVPFTGRASVVPVLIVRLGCDFVGEVEYIWDAVKKRYKGSSKGFGWVRGIFLDQNTVLQQWRNHSYGNDVL